jgi:hypothetical protein
VVSTARHASPPVSPPPASSDSRFERSSSFHRSLEPSPDPEPRPAPTQNESPGSSLPPSAPASPTPSFTDRMAYLTVQLADKRRVIYRAYQRE